MLFAIPLLLGLGVFVLPAHAQGATLSLSPSTGTVADGQTITVSVRVNAGGQAMNSAEGTVSFPKDMLQLQSVSKSGSIFTFWTTEPSGSNASGRVVFAGGLPSPGYSGSKGTILKMTFLAKKEGTATLTMSGGKILANDGLGTNILTSQTGASYTIKQAAEKPQEEKPTTPSAPILSSPTHPEQTLWYAAETATVRWTKPAGLIDVSWSFTRDLTSIPDDTAEPNTGTADITLPADGTWYFQIRGRYETGWSAIGHYELRRDRTPPEPFTLNLQRDRGDTDPSPVLVFMVTDTTSGIRKTVMVLDGGEEQEVTSPAPIILGKAGEHTVIVTAYDLAGNKRESTLRFTMEGYAPPVITFLSSPVILLEPLVVRGTAALGDTVTIFVDGESIGSVVVGGQISAETPQSQESLPWIFRSDRLFRPGAYQVTATAINALGQESVTTDPRTYKVSGQHVLIGGRSLATIAVAPAVAIFGLLLSVIILTVLARSFFLLLRLHHRVVQVDRAVASLRAKVMRGRVSLPAVEESLAEIDRSLHPQSKRRSGKRRLS